MVEHSAGKKICKRRVFEATRKFDRALVSKELLTGNDANVDQDPFANFFGVSTLNIVHKYVYNLIH